jgi:hypothetical protein
MIVAELPPKPVMPDPIFPLAVLAIIAWIWLVVWAL